MARKGAVKRMNNAASSQPELKDEGPMPERWRRSQDHFNRFTALIKQELDDETQLVEERWKTWTKQRLLLAGVFVVFWPLKQRICGRVFYLL